MLTKLQVSLLYLSLFTSVGLCTSANKEANYPNSFASKTNVGISFTENKGQIHDQNYQPRPDVLFGAMAGDLAFHLNTTGVSYQLYRIDKYKAVEDPITKEKRKEIDQQTIYRIDLNWLNANQNFNVSKDETLLSYNNYYTKDAQGRRIKCKAIAVLLYIIYIMVSIYTTTKKTDNLSTIIL